MRGGAGRGLVDPLAAIASRGAYGQLRGLLSIASFFSGHHCALRAGGRVRVSSGVQDSRASEARIGADRSSVHLGGTRLYGRRRSVHVYAGGPRERLRHFGSDDCSHYDSKPGAAHPFWSVATFASADPGARCGVASGNSAYGFSPDWPVEFAERGKALGLHRSRNPVVAFAGLSLPKYRPQPPCRPVLHLLRRPVRFELS